MGEWSDKGGFVLGDLASFLFGPLEAFIDGFSRHDSLHSYSTLCYIGTSQDVNDNGWPCLFHQATIPTLYARYQTLIYY